MATIIDGKKLAAEVRGRAAERAARLMARAVPCGRAVVLVGDDQGSATYVRAKLRDCEECGIPSQDFKLPGDTPQGELMSLIEQLNADPSIAGILVQMPLPAHIDAEQVVAAIDPTMPSRLSPRSIPRRTSTAFTRRIWASSSEAFRGFALAHPPASWRCSTLMVSTRQARTR